MRRRNTFITAAFVAAAFPVAAHARPIEDPVTPVPRPAPAPARPIVVTHDDGFQWADAGIGAAGAFLLAGSAGVGSVLVRRRRVARPLAG
jgi:hypothetical protein